MDTVRAVLAQIVVDGPAAERVRDKGHGIVSGGRHDFGELRDPAVLSGLERVGELWKGMRDAACFQLTSEEALPVSLTGTVVSVNEHDHRSISVSGDPDRVARCAAARGGSAVSVDDVSEGDRWRDSGRGARGPCGACEKE